MAPFESQAVNSFFLHFLPLCAKFFKRCYETDLSIRLQAHTHRKSVTRTLRHLPQCHTKSIQLNGPQQSRFSKAVSFVTVLLPLEIKFNLYCKHSVYI